MQNYRAGPVGPVGARGVPRGTGEGTSGGRAAKRETRQEGPAAPQPTSTSGLVKVSAAGPSVPPFLLRLRHLVRFLFFLFARSNSLSVPLFLARSVSLRSVPGPSSPSRRFDGVRTALSRHTVLGPTPSPVPSRVLRPSFFSCTGPTYDPAKSQLVEIPV